MVFMLAICVVTDGRYSKIPSYMQPLYVGFAMLSIGIAYGANSGYGLNPARDLAPRLVSFLSGYGVGVFRYRLISVHAHSAELIRLKHFKFSGLQLVLGVHRWSTHRRHLGILDLPAVAVNASSKSSRTPPE